MLAQLQKNGGKPQPVLAFQGALGTTFWGKKWCDNLERSADWAAKLPRGRIYVRHGSVCHLEIATGEIRAKVLGQHLYNVRIRIDPLSRDAWKALCSRCAGQIDSLMDVLKGTMPERVMDIMCAPVSGIFPAPEDLRFSCSCPDYASLCKHVAAALYGVARRLDEAPEQIFRLRGVDPADLLQKDMFATPTDTPAGILRVDDLGALFGIDLVTDLDVTAPEPEKEAPPAQSAVDTACPPEPASPSVPETPQPPAESVSSPEPSAKRRSKASSDSKAGETQASVPKEGTVVKPRGLIKPYRPTGTAVRNLRRFSQLDAHAFADAVGVTLATVQRWESTRGVLQLREQSLQALMAFQYQLLEEASLLY